MTYEDWNRWFQVYVNKSENELRYAAYGAADLIYEALKYGGYRARARDLLLQIFASFAIVDGEVTQKELKLFQDVTRDLFDDYYSYEDFEYYAKKNYQTNYLHDLDYFLSDRPEIKEEIAKLGLAICAIDGHIISPEINFILDVAEY